MENLLFLSQRIPYPPNKGDKIRSWNILKRLSKYYKIHLGAFVDDPYDWRYEEDIAKICTSYKLLPLSPFWSKVKSLKAFSTNEPLSIPYYHHCELQRWVDSILKIHKPPKVYIFCSAMSQYLSDTSPRILLDMVDLDSQKWAQYALQKTFPLNWIYQREAKTLLAYEKKVTERFSASLLVSSNEADEFKTLVPASLHSKIHTIENGIDDTYFSPLSDQPCQKKLVFTGAMDYWPNIDAVVWFSKHVFPALQKIDPSIEFHIVGANPSKEVIALTENPDIKVLGRVKDIRDHIQQAYAIVAPLQIAQGIQNKVLEGMAMEKIVITTTKAALGIPGIHQKDFLIANTVEEFIQAYQNIPHYPKMGHAARLKVKKIFNWDAKIQKIHTLLEDSELK